MAKQSTLTFSSSPRDANPVRADKAPSPARSTSTKTSRECESLIASSDAPSTAHLLQLSTAPLLPATFAMESSFELPDSTDWLSTFLPAFEPLEAALRCEVCKEFYNNPVITSCAHTFCSLCIRRCIAADGKCPACKSGCQADKLQPNIVVREVATRFQDARPKALELARAKDKEDDGETAATAGGRKRKREGAGGEEEGRRTTRSTQTRRSTRLGNEVIMTNDMPVVIPDSDEEKEDEYLPEGMVSCPICKKSMKEEAVFNHIPVCPAAQEDDGARKTRSRNNDAFPNSMQSRKKNNEPPPTRLSGLHYPMLNEKALRKKLQELGIPTWGTKPQLIKRHQEWLNIYNSNCDASDAARKSKRELLRELDEWERTQGGSANHKESHIMRKDFDGQNYASTHKSQFDDLIANARKRAQATSAPNEEKGDTPSTENPGTNALRTQRPHTQKAEPTPNPSHPYENNESALASIRQKVEQANRTDSTFPPLNPSTEVANMKAARNAALQQQDVPLGIASPTKNPLGSPTRKVPMFRMPEEPVLDVESSTTMQ